MKFTIDEDACNKVKLSIPEVLMILLVRTGVDIQELIESMKNKQILIEEVTLMGNSLLISQGWNNLCDKALFSVDKDIPKEEEIINLANSLMECYPKGKKEGTSQYWRGNVREITLRLQKFFKLYGNKYTNKQLIEATKKYVSSFNGDYRFMRILKYFIYKNDRKFNAEGAGIIEEVSDLAAYIENEGQDSHIKENWDTTLI